MWELLKTKTVRVAIAAILAGVGMIIAGEVPAGIQTIVIALMGICGRDAVRKVENGKK